MKLSEASKIVRSVIKELGMDTKGRVRVVREPDYEYVAINFRGMTWEQIDELNYKLNYCDFPPHIQLDEMR